MIKKIFNYVIFKPWNKICDDIEQYETIKRNCKNAAENMKIWRRMLVRPFSTYEVTRSVPSCIKRQVYFPIAADSVSESRPVIMEFYCENFKDNGVVSDEELCHNTKCPKYEEYQKYMEQRRKYDLFVAQKKKYWKEKLFELKK